VALRRVVRLDAEWFPFNLDPAGLAARRADLAGLLDASGNGNGRSIDDVFITIRPLPGSDGPEHVQAFADAGAHQVVTFLPRGSSSNVEAGLDDLAKAYGLSS